MSDDVPEAPAAEIPEGFRVLPWRRGFGRLTGPVFARPGEAGPVFGLRVEDHHTNGLHNAHGGMLMTLADVAWGSLVSYECSAFWVTVRLTCDFLAAARLGDWIEAGGDILHREDDLFTVRGRVWCGERALLVGSGVFKMVSPRAPRPGERAYVAEAA